MKKVKAICKNFWFHRGHKPEPALEKLEEPAAAPQKDEKFERCVLCGDLTDIPVAMPIAFRENYVVGIGQVCSRCKYELRLETNENATLSDAQVMKAVEASREK